MPHCQAIRCNTFLLGGRVWTQSGMKHRSCCSAGSKLVAINCMPLVSRVQGPRRQTVAKCRKNMKIQNMSRYFQGMPHVRTNPYSFQAFIVGRKICFQDLEGLELGAFSHREFPGLLRVIQMKLLGSRHQLSMGKLRTDPPPNVCSIAGTSYMPEHMQRHIDAACQCSLFIRYRIQRCR